MLSRATQYLFFLGRSGREQVERQNAQTSEVKKRKKAELLAAKKFLCKRSGEHHFGHLGVNNC
jgi:hypothetical protein